MAAANLETMQSGRRTDLQPDANLHEVSRVQAAELLQVSPRSVATASKVKRTAHAEVSGANKPRCNQCRFRYDWRYILPAYNGPARKWCGAENMCWFGVVAACTLALWGRET